MSRAVQLLLPGTLVLTSSVLLAPFAVAQAAAEVGVRIAQLDDPQLHTAAHEQLVGLGAAGVPAILQQLQDADDELATELLSVLIEMGPAAGSAVPELFELARYRKKSKADFVGAAVELVPWRPADSTVDVQALWHEMLRKGSVRDPNTFEYQVSWHRLNARYAFPRAPSVDVLLAIVQQHNPFRVELAIEHLGHRGAEAAPALPALRRILERPEPRILTTNRTVPLHDKAACAVLAIAPADKLAAVARDVLARRRPPPAPAGRVLPGRIRARIDELIADLAVPDRRAAAVANLAAFGDVAAEPVAAALLVHTDAAAIDAVLAVLRMLGPRGAAAVPGLVDSLGKLPGKHTLAAFDALIATLPWSNDFLPSSGMSFGPHGEVWLFKQQVGGGDFAFADAMWRAAARLAARMTVDPASTIDELAGLLADPSVEVRECALVALLDKGDAARPLLPTLATMLNTAQPPRSDLVWPPSSDNPAKLVDRTPFVRRLAAEVIVAAAPPDDLRLPQARTVLAVPQPK